MARQSPRSKPAPTRPVKQGRAAHLIVGELGEALVTDWVRSEGGTVLAERWHCVTGELDIVAQFPPGILEATETVIAFIEVKTRRRGTWDAEGLLAITPQKQNKLWRTARFFLKKHPHLAAMPCRFDVALVRCQGKLAKPKRQTCSQSNGDLLPPSNGQVGPSSGNANHADVEADIENRLSFQEEQPVKLGEAMVRGDYRLTIQQYLVDAFTL